MFIKVMFSRERKIVPLNSAHMPTLLFHEAKTDKTEEQQDYFIAFMIAEPDFTQELIRVVCFVTLKLLSKTSVSVATSGRGIIKIDVFLRFEQRYPCKVAHGVLDMFAQNLFYVRVANASTSVIKIANHQRVATTSPAASERLHI